MSHLIFFDHSCTLCKEAVQQIQKRDTNHQFALYPLKSQMAKEKLSPKLLKGDTLVLLENGTQVWTRARAIFRIAHLLGGKDKWMGIFCYVPGLDLIYRFVAKHRHR